MTVEEREEAIHFFETASEKEVGRFSKLAIEALKLFPCDDCVSRKDALKLFTYNSKGERIPERDIDNFPTSISIEDAKKMIRTLPSVSCTW